MVASSPLVASKRIASLHRSEDCVGHEVRKESGQVYRITYSYSGAMTVIVYASSRERTSSYVSLMMYSIEDQVRMSAVFQELSGEELEVSAVYLIW